MLCSRLPALSMVRRSTWATCAKKQEMHGHPGATRSLKILMRSRNFPSPCTAPSMVAFYLSRWRLSLSSSMTTYHKSAWRPTPSRPLQMSPSFGTRSRAMTPRWWCWVARNATRWLMHCTLPQITLIARRLHSMFSTTSSGHIVERSSALDPETKHLRHSAENNTGSYTGSNTANSVKYIQHSPPQRAPLLPPRHRVPKQIQMQPLPLKDLGLWTGRQSQ